MIGRTEHSEIYMNKIAALSSMTFVCKDDFPAVYEKQGRRERASPSPSIAKTKTRLANLSADHSHPGAITAKSRLSITQNAHPPPKLNPQSHCDSSNQTNLSHSVPIMADAPRGGGAARGGDRGGFGSRGGERGGDRGRGRGGRRGPRRGGNKSEEKEWQPVTKLGRLVKAGKIKSMEEIYLHSLPIKEYQIVDFFLPKLKDEVMKVIGRPFLDSHHNEEREREREKKQRIDG